jgi:hypothetical protein
MRLPQRAAPVRLHSHDLSLAPPLRQLPAVAEGPWPVALPSGTSAASPRRREIRERRGACAHPKFIRRKIAVLWGMIFLLQGHSCARRTSCAKDNSVPGSTQTATCLSSGAEKPVVEKLNRWVVSLSPTFAGRVLSLQPPAILPMLNVPSLFGLDGNKKTTYNIV